MEERQESQGFFEMLWDCDHCEMKGLLGKSQRHCPECGAKQNPDLRYFPKQGEQTRIDGHRFEGSDRHCPACNAPQSAKAHNCTNCGAPQDGAREVRGFVAKMIAPKPRSSRRWIWILAALAVVAAIIAIVIYKRRTVEQQLVVTEHRWQRAIGVEEYRDEQDHAWRDGVPRDARNASCHMKQRSTRQIEDGETCKLENVDRKDGTFEQINKCRPKYRSVPIEDDWCTFTVRRWKPVDAVKVVGVGLAPVWPTAGLPALQASEVVGARRQGKQTQELTLVFGTQVCEGVSEAVWRKYADGAAVQVEVRASSGEIVCDSL